MNSTDRRYWFFLDGYVHVSVKGKRILLYNPLNGATLEYCDQPEVLALMETLCSDDNLWVVELSEADVRSGVVREFVESVREQLMGDLIDSSRSNGRPVQMMPIVTNRMDVQRLGTERGRSSGEEVGRYLREVHLYVNESCGGECEACSNGYERHLCCATTGNSGGEFELGTIDQLFVDSLANLNVLGGNLLRYSKLRELVDLLSGRQFGKVFHIHYLNMGEGRTRARWLNIPDARIKLLATFPLHRRELRSAWEWIETSGVEGQVEFVVRSEEEANEAQTMAEDLAIGYYTLQPYFTGENTSFFGDNVFVTKEDLISARPKVHEVRANGLVNRASFGRVSVLSNGDIHANRGTAPIGNLRRGSLCGALYEEMKRGESWLKTRECVAPCKDCTYASLCPPLSSLEQSMGRNDLCHMRQERQATIP